MDDQKTSLCLMLQMSQNLLNIIIRSCYRAVFPYEATSLFNKGIELREAAE